MSQSHTESVTGDPGEMCKHIYELRNIDIFFFLLIKITSTTKAIGYNYLQTDIRWCDWIQK